ncbi:MAG: hypothetical protein PHX93_01540 [Candidatus Peribacteraceae bacterium]|jgi:hypothetical protein|nr:hypothetical protein [Candidatus Peribacteraceae bacterium]
MFTFLKRLILFLLVLALILGVGFMLRQRFSSPSPSAVPEPSDLGEPVMPPPTPVSDGLPPASPEASSAVPTVNDGSPEGVFREALQAFYEAQTYEQYKAATLRYADSAVVQQALATPDDEITPQQKEQMLLAVKMILPVPDSVGTVRTEMVGDAATLTVTVQGSDKPLTVTLVREDGAWKWHQLRVGA